MKEKSNDLLQKSREKEQNPLIILRYLTILQAEIKRLKKIP